MDIRGTALEVVERMGLAEQVREQRTQIYTLSVVRGGGPKTIDAAIRPLHEMRGDREIEIMRDDLVRILLDAIADDVEVIYGDTVATVERNAESVRVRLAGGTEYDVDLVVGADGHHSDLRAMEFGPEDRYLHHLGAYLGIFTVDNLLGLRDRAVIYSEPGRGAAMFTVRGNNRAKALLMFRSAKLDIDLRDRAALETLLRNRFDGAGWETRRLLDVMGDAYDFYFDEMSQVHLPRWSSDRVALLGDAAFGPSPLSGQGTSLALIGAYLLAHELASTPTDVVGALDRWERGFRANVEQNQRLATSGMKVLLPASRAQIFVRNQAMRAMPLITRLGAGFSGELERASRGITLPPDAVDRGN